MNRIAILVLSYALFFAQQQALSQKVKQIPNPEKAPHSLSLEAWEKMNDRWQPYSTRVNITKNDGTIVEGQLTWMSDSLMMVQKNFDLPNGIMNPDDYTMIPVRDIASIKVRIGGYPYQGLITGILAGVIPGFVTGAILAQGWTIVPAIVFGAVTAGGGGAIGSVIQKANRKHTFEIKADILSGRLSAQMKKAALFPNELVKLPGRTGEASITDFENLLKQSSTLRRAFPDNPFAISIHSSIMTNSIRKRLQNWYMSPYWGSPDAYYETRIGLEADLSKRMGKKFQAGLLFQLFPGDISSSFFNKYYPEWNVNYSYTHHFQQTTFGIYGGWLLQPADKYRASRLEASIQIGAVVSDVYEHFYFQWNAVYGDATGETFIQKHHFQPGAMMRIKTSWYLIPGFSIDTGLEGFLIKRVLFNERTVLPQTSDGPKSITRHTLNFSNIQGFAGFSIHF